MNQDFNNYSSSVNIDEIWNAIEPQVDAINTKRKWQWFFPRFAFASLLAVGLILLFFWWNSSSPATIYADAPHSSSLSPLSEGSNSVLVIEKESEEKSASKKNVVENEDHNLKTPNTTSSIARKNSKNYITKNTPTPFTPLPSSTILSNISTQENPNPHAVLNVPKTSYIGRINEVNKEATSLSSSKALPTIHSFDRAAASNDNLAINAQKASEISSTGSFPISNLAAQKSATALATLPTISILDTPTEIALSAPPYEKMPLSFVEDNDLLISIIAEAGIGKAMRTLELKEGGNQQIFDLRKNNGKSLEFIQAALLGRIMHPSGFYLATGAAYGQINDVYENRSVVNDTITTEGIVSRIVDLNGDTTDVYGPVDTYLEKQINKKFYTTYRMIDIPVYIGFAYQFNEWETDFSFGYIANLSLLSSGKIPNSAVEEFELADDSDNVLIKSKINHSFELAFGVNRQVGERMYVGIKPTMRLYPKSFTTDEYGIHQKYITLGLKMGVRYDLN